MLLVVTMDAFASMLVSHRHPSLTRTAEELDRWEQTWIEQA